MSDPLTDATAAFFFTAEHAWDDRHSRSFWPREPVPTVGGKPRCWGVKGGVMGLYQCREPGTVTLADGSTWCGAHAPKNP